jgi:hypothetical protein
MRTHIDPDPQIRTAAQLSNRVPRQRRITGAQRQAVNAIPTAPGDVCRQGGIAVIDRQGVARTDVVCVFSGFLCEVAVQ